MSTTAIIVGVIVIILILIIAIYNGLVRAKTRVDEAWSDITVQLKRRYDLIPNLVETVKGYAAHEKTVLEDVTNTRAQAINAQGPKEQAKAEDAFSGALKSLFAVSENYPNLKANENFKALQDELVDTEDKIQAARRFYNGSARDLNIKIKTFPNVIFAGMLGYKPYEFFEVSESEKEAVSKPTAVKF
ncbi:MAG TPA: LemA family protein [Candidatus Saccharimonadales bacterium]|nr:LemA family protein [Candidatus Saccharimonadales bacterium]